MENGRYIDTDKCRGARGEREKTGGKLAEPCVLATIYKICKLGMFCRIASTLQT